MITWIQNYLFKHLKWVIGGLLVVLIVVFIFMGTPGSFSGNSSGGRPQHLFGYDFNSPKSIRDLAERTQISRELQLSSENIVTLMVERAALLHLANAVGLPEPSKPQLQTYFQILPLFAPNGQFRQDTYQRFVAQFRQQADGSDAQLVATMIEDYRIAQAKSALLDKGFILSEEVEQELMLSQTQWDIEFVELDYDAFEYETSQIDEDELRNYFNQNSEYYRTARKVTLSGLLFPNDGFIDTVEIEEPQESLLRAYYQRNRSRFQPTTELAGPIKVEEESLDTGNADATAPIAIAEIDPQEAEDQGEEEASLSSAIAEEEAEFVAVRSTVLEAWLQEQRLRESRLAAQYAAAEFAVELDKQSIQRASADFEAALSASQGTRVALPTLTQGIQAEANSLDIPPNILAREGFSLDESRYFSAEPVFTAQGSVLLILEKDKPASIPDF